MATKKREPSPRRRPAAGAPRSAPNKSDRWWRAGLAILAVVAVSAVVVGSTGCGGAGDDGNGDEPASSAEGLLQTGPPWPPQYDGLEDRVGDAGFPPVGDESYHVHALLSVFVEGRQVTVPTDIGIDRPRRFISPLHTHTPDGVIHFEADDPAPFTLGQVFDVWGVAFDGDRLGDRTTTATDSVQVYVNGGEVEDPRSLELADGDNVVVAYGRAGSFPVEPPTEALDELS